MTTHQSRDFPRRLVVASMTGIIITMFMAALDATIVGTAMPRLVADLNGFELYAAVTTVYLLATTVVVPIVGKLSDIYGRKPFLLAGVLIFIGGSALCGAAQTMTQLVLFRGLQGIGGGFSQAMAFTTIADLFPPSRRGRVSGMLGAVFGLASVTGPAVGGFLTDGPGWRWCFYVNVPIGALAFAILLFGFPHLVTRRKEHTDRLAGCRHADPVDGADSARAGVGRPDVSVAVAGGAGAVGLRPGDVRRLPGRRDARARGDHAAAHVPRPRGRQRRLRRDAHRRGDVRCHAVHPVVHSERARAPRRRAAAPC